MRQRLSLSVNISVNKPKSPFSLMTGGYSIRQPLLPFFTNSRFSAFFSLRPSKP
mgnify:CR=1 FL=1